MMTFANTFRLPAVLLATTACSLMVALPGTVSAQESTSREVVQPLPSKDVQRLNRALLQLAKRPKSVEALLEAGEASVGVNDLDAAIGFYGRADDLSPNDPRVKLGKAKIYLRSGRPIEALPLYAAAQSSGANANDVLPDRALAFDMVGDNTSAQAAYKRVISLNSDNVEAKRRLAISYAISGNRDGFEETLRPLIDRRDFGSFRARAFGLAIMGEQKRASAIVDAVMPRDLATRINPYLEFMPRLTKSQQAAAANLGIFPRAADIGRDDPRIAAYTGGATTSAQPTVRTADSRLAPVGAPLGTVAAETATLSEPRSRAIETVALPASQPAEAEPAAKAVMVQQEVQQPVPTVAQTVTVSAASPVATFDLAKVAPTSPGPSDPVPVEPAPTQGSAVAVSQPVPVRQAIVTPQVATAQQSAAAPTLTSVPVSTSIAAPTPAPTPVPAPTFVATPVVEKPKTPSVADAFSDLGVARAAEVAPAADAVDLSSIEIPVETTAAKEEAETPAKPDHPARIWVQLATGRDLSALKFDWRRFSRKAPGLLDKFDPHTVPWGQANRLLAGPVTSRKAASDLINALKSEGIETFRYSSPEGTEIKELK